MLENQNERQLEKSSDRIDAEKLLPQVYDELRKLAGYYLSKEYAGHSLQATALVHEAYLRLVGIDSRNDWKNRGHFFGAAAIAIRRILVDHARRKRSLKRGGNLDREQFHEELPISLSEPVEDLIALDEALDKLFEKDPASAELVQLVYFSGLTLREAAELLNISPRSADRTWAFARAWLRLQLRGNED